jgi:hypothetical protein
MHDGATVGRAKLPPTSLAAFSQADLKKGSCSGIAIVCLCFVAQVQPLPKNFFETKRASPVAARPRRSAAQHGRMQSEHA